MKRKPIKIIRVIEDREYEMYSTQSKDSAMSEIEKEFNIKLPESYKKFINKNHTGHLMNKTYVNTKYGQEFIQAFLNVDLNTFLYNIEKERDQLSYKFDIERTDLLPFALTKYDDYFCFKMPNMEIMFVDSNDVVKVFNNFDEFLSNIGYDDDDEPDLVLENMKYIKENLESTSMSFEEFKIQLSNPKNIHSMLQTKSNEIQKIKTKYNISFKIPKTLLALFAFEGCHISFNDNSTLRIVTLDEILNIEKEYKIDCVSKQCIPIVDYFDNNYVIYDLDNRIYQSMDITNGSKVDFIPKHMKLILDALKANNIREVNESNTKVSSTSSSSYLEIDPKFIENELKENEGANIVESFLNEYITEDVDTSPLEKLKAYTESTQINCSGGISNMDISKAETILEMTFSKTFKTYLSTYGSIIENNSIIFGVGNNVPNINNMVLHTKEARQTNINFPRNYLVIESIDKYNFTVVDDKDNIYKYQTEPKFEFEKLPIKFENYVLTKVKKRTYNRSI